MIYFDNAATSGKKPQTVINAVRFALENYSSNPGRSGHNLSQKSASAVFNVRQKVSDYFVSTGPETVVFTQNCTQSINYVLKGVLKKGMHIIISDLEHNAVMRPLTALDIDYTVVNIDIYDDNKTLNNIRNAIKPNTKLILCTAASNVIGKVLPIKEIGKICNEKGILFCVDAAQGAGVIDINMDEMCIDFLCIAPHKGLYAPMGIGILIVKKPIEKTIIEGGTGTESLNFKQPNLMPEMLESGTLNLPGIMGIGAGIDFVKERHNCFFNHETALVNHFYDKLNNTSVKFYINPHVCKCAPVVSFNVDNVESEIVAEYLNKKGFALRAGLHCAPMAHKKINTTKQGTVRFSPSIFNNHNEVEQLIKILKNFKK